MMKMMMNTKTGRRRRRDFSTFPSYGKAVAPRCTTTPFEVREDATDYARRIKKTSRVDTRTVFCKPCNAYHLILKNGQLDTLDVEIIKLLAMGFRQREILRELEIHNGISLTRKKLDHRIESLYGHFRALSSANLVAIAMWLSIIDISPFAPEKETNVHSNAS